MVIAGVIASAPTAGMRNLGSIVFVIVGIAGILPAGYLGLDCARWALSWQVDWLENDGVLVLLILVGLAGLAALALIIGVITLACGRRTRTLLVRAVLLGLAGTEIEGALLKLEGPQAWLVGSYGRQIPSWKPPPFSDSLSDAAVDQHDNVYTAGHGEIDTFSPSGKHMRHWNIASPCCIDNVVVSASGNVYGTDSSSPLVSPGPHEHLPASVVELSPRGRTVRTWTEPDQDPYSVVSPQLAAIVQHGSIYVVDRGNDRLTRLSPTLRVLSAWH
jgi:hypothetical protein